MNRIYAFVVISVTLCRLASRCSSDTPNFVPGDGIIVHSVSKLNAELYELTVATAAVNGKQQVRILLPRDYTISSQDRRYPVLSWLHGGAGNATDLTTDGRAQDILGHSPLITVMPDGGSFGWYTNWLNPGNAAPQNWGTFHTEQLVPWIDLNLRTVAEKRGKLSWVFQWADLVHFGMLRSILIDSILQQVFRAHSIYYTYGFRQPFSVQWILRTENLLMALLVPYSYHGRTKDRRHKIRLRMQHHWEALRLHFILAIKVSILEASVRDTSYRMRDILQSLSIPVYFHDYGNGASIGEGCNGGHDFSCWSVTLKDVMSRMMTVLHRQ